MNRSVKRRRLILLMAAVVILAAWGVSQFLAWRVEQRMLRAVGLEDRPELYRVALRSWTDWLQYTDGYEILYLGNRENDGRSLEKRVPWTPPGTWTREHVTIDELIRRFHEDINEQAITGESMGGYVCDAWFFLDRRDQQLPLGEREYYLGFWDEGEDMVYIYHGHHLYGS